MKEALGVIDELKERYANVVVQDKGKRYNTDLLEAVELGFLIELAEVITIGALARKESRGGHFREDYEARDDVNFMRHTMAYRAPVTEGPAPSSAMFADEVRLDYKPVTVTRYQPMERKY
jgi:succinate dehydrogenase / fumarate reductase flavoprotein subunit